jgi:hypothetical protein
MDGGMEGWMGAAGRVHCRVGFVGKKKKGKFVREIHEHIARVTWVWTKGSIEIMHL